MSYIVIEKHGGWEYAAICSDEEGNNLLFDTLEEAQKEADDCQDGIIVGDDDDKLYLIREMYEALRDGSTVIHIGDLIAQTLGINATFLPSGKIIEND